MDIKEIRKEAIASTEAKIHRKAIGFAFFAEGSFAAENESEFELSSLSKYMKDDDLVDSSRALVLKDDRYVPSSIPIDESIPVKLDGSDGFSLKSDGFSLSFVPQTTGEHDSELASQENGIVDYMLSDSCVLTAKAKENGLDIEVLFVEAQKEYSQSFSLNSDTGIFVSDESVINCKNKRNETVFRFGEAFIIDGNGNSYDGCEYELDGGILKVVADSSVIADLSFPIIIHVPVLKVQDYVVELDAEAKPVDSTYCIGRKSGESLSLDILVDSETIIHLLENKGIGSFQSILKLHYLNDSEIRIPGSQGFVIEDNSGLYKEESLSDEEGVLSIDITDSIRRELRSYRKGANSPAKRKITVSYAEDETLDGIRLPDDDYVKIYDIDATDVALRPSIDVLLIDDGVVREETPYHFLKTGEAGVSSVCMKNGYLTHDVALGTFTEGTLSVPVVLHYDSRLIAKSGSFGQHWILSLERKIIKHPWFSKTNGEKRVSYRDGNGNTHFLEETWYYEEDGVRHDIDWKDVYLGIDGKYKYILTENGASVEKEAYVKTESEDGFRFYRADKSQGIAAESGLKIDRKKSSLSYVLGSNGFEATDLSRNELTITAFYYRTTADKIPWPEKYLKNKDAEVLVFPSHDEIRETCNGTLVLDDGVILQKKTVKAGFTLTDSGAVLFFPRYMVIEGSDDILEFGISEYVARLDAVYTTDGTSVSDLPVTEDLQSVESRLLALDTSIDQLEATLKSLRSSKGSLSYVSAYSKVSARLGDASYSRLCAEISASDEMTDLSSLTADEQNKTRQYRNARDEYNASSNDQRKESDAYNRISAEEQEDSANDQIGYYNGQMFDLVRQRLSLLRLKENYEKEAKKGTCSYILDESGNVLSFDCYGKLVSITDVNDNAISIAYENNKISSISGKSGKSILIRYDEHGYPESMLMQDGQRYDFEYDGLLSKLSWLGENRRECNAVFSYDSSSRLSGVLSPDIRETFFSYSSGHVSRLCSMCLAEEINSDGVTLLSSPRKDVDWSFSFPLWKPSEWNDDINSQSVTYCFDSSCRLVSSETVNGDETLLRLRCPSDDGTVHSFSVNPGQGRDFITEISSGGKQNSNSISIFVKDDGIEERAKTGAFIAFLVRLDRSYLECRFANQIILTVEQGGDEGLLSTDECKYEGVFDGYVGLPVKLNPDTTELVFQVSCFRGMKLDFSKISFLLCNAKGGLFTYDEEGRLVKEVSNRYTKEYSDYVLDIPSREVSVDNSGAKKTSLIRTDGSMRPVFYDFGNGRCLSVSYDEKNRIVEKRQFEIDDPSACSVTRYSYSADGVAVEKEGSLRDSDGRFPPISKVYDLSSGLLLKEKYPGGRCIVHGYDPYTKEETSMSSDIRGHASVTLKSYRYGLLTRLSHDGADFRYGYDGKGRKLWMSMGDAGIRLLTWEYADATSDSSFALSNGSMVRSYDCMGYEECSVYDRYGRVESKTIGNYSFSYIYNEQGFLSEARDDGNGIVELYEYDIDGDVLRYSKDEDGRNITKEYSYDRMKRTVGITVSVDSETISETSVKYDDNDRIVHSDSFSAYGTLVTDRSYDSSGLVTRKSVETDGVGMVTEIRYLRQEEHKSSLVSSYDCSIQGEILSSQSFDYDVSGNIVQSMCKDGNSVYSYDEFGRIIKEEHDSGRKSVYCYDLSGNVTEIKEYQEGQLLKRKILRYGNSEWKDQVTYVQVVSDESNEEYCFSYDEMGRPTEYFGQYVCWNPDGTMASIASADYQYDSRGYCIRVSSDRGETKYIYDEERLLRMETPEGTWDFLWSDSMVEGFRWQDREYLYVRNAFGDIVGIYDVSDRALCAVYSYDAYGNHFVYDAQGNDMSDDSSFIGCQNPFRYRGYFYDVDSRLYRLEKRLYDPCIGRFVSPDAFYVLDETKGCIHGLNLYLYCYDNPIKYADPSGRMPLLCALLLLGAIGAIASFASQAIGDTISGEGFDMGRCLIAGASGFVGGVLTAVPGIGQKLGPVVSSAMNTALQMWYSGEDYSAGDYIAASLLSALRSVATAKVFSSVMKGIPYFENANFFTEHFVEFATDAYGIELSSSIIYDMAVEVAARNTIYSGLNTIFDYIMPYDEIQDWIYKLAEFLNKRKTGLEP